jgi:hypothetical protein
MTHEKQKEIPQSTTWGVHLENRQTYKKHTSTLSETEACLNSQLLYALSNDLKMLLICQLDTSLLLNHLHK